MNKRMGLDIGLLFRVYRYIRREKPDVVHTHLRAIMYIAFAIMRKNGVMYCHTVHSAADKEAGGSFISSGMRKFCFHRGWITPITISAESLHSFRKYYGMDAPMISMGAMWMLVCLFQTRSRNNLNSIDIQIRREY